MPAKICLVWQKNFLAVGHIANYQTGPILSYLEIVKYWGKDAIRDRYRLLNEKMQTMAQVSSFDEAKALIDDWMDYNNNNGYMV